MKNWIIAFLLAATSSSAIGPAMVSTTARRHRNSSNYSATGQLIGQWHDAKLAGSLHGVIVLDDLDLNLLNDDTGSVLGPSKVFLTERTAIP